MEILIALILTIGIYYFFSSKTYKTTTNKSYEIINKKFSDYNEKGYANFEYVDTYDWYYKDKGQFIRIEDSILIFNGKKYKIDDSLNIKYSLASNRATAAVLINNKDYFHFNNGSIDLSNLLACIIIVYFIKEKITQINFSIIDEYANRLKDDSLNVYLKRTDE